MIFLYLMVRDTWRWMRRPPANSWHHSVEGWKAWW